MLAQFDCRHLTVFFSFKKSTDFYIFIILSTLTRFPVPHLLNHPYSTMVPAPFFCFFYLCGQCSMGQMPVSLFAVSLWLKNSNYVSLSTKQECLMALIIHAFRMNSYFPGLSSNNQVCLPLLKNKYLRKSWQKIKIELLSHFCPQLELNSNSNMETKQEDSYKPVHICWSNAMSKVAHSSRRCLNPQSRH